jgi:hypothetical protein
MPRFGFSARQRQFSSLWSLATSITLEALPVGHHLHGVWRRLVARVVRDDEVAGSNPVTPTLS